MSMDSSTGTPFVQYLPEGQAPRRLTAVHRSKNLKEHFESFVAINGLRRTSKDNTETTKAVLELLTILASRPSVTFRQFKKTAALIRRMFDPPLSERNIVEKNARHFLAQTLGYANYAEVWDTYVRGVSLKNILDTAIENRRHTAPTTKVIEHVHTNAVLKGGLPELQAVIDGFQLDQPRPALIPGDWQSELIRFAWYDTATREQFSKAARELKVALVDRFKHNELLIALAWTFGYKDWQDITTRYPDKAYPVPNLRKQNQATSIPLKD